MRLGSVGSCRVVVPVEVKSVDSGEGRSVATTDEHRVDAVRFHGCPRRLIRARQGE